MDNLFPQQISKSIYISLPSWKYLRESKYDIYGQGSTRYQHVNVRPMSSIVHWIAKLNFLVGGNSGIRPYDGAYQVNNICQPLKQQCHEICLI